MTQEEMMADISRMADEMRAMVASMVMSFDKQDRQLREISSLMEEGHVIHQ